MSIKIQISGLAELGKRLNELPYQVRDKLMKGAVSTGAAIVRDEAIRLAPIYPGRIGKNHPPAGFLKKNIYISRLAEECNGTREVWQVNVKRYHGAYYAHMVEYGTAKMGDTPFMRPAWQAKQGAALDAIGTYLAFGLPDLVADK